MTNKIKDQIGFHYLLIIIWLHEFILLQLSMFHKKKSKINPSLTVYLEYKMMIPLCVDFTVSRS